MITLAIIAAAIATLLLYYKYIFKYWEKRGVKHDKPWPIFGNNARNYFMQLSVSQIAAEMYWKYPKEKVVGFYRASQPELVVRDPEIAKRILTTDFAHLYPRGLNANKTIIEPLLRNLFFADGDLWRLLRQRMTATFSSAKLRAMFPLICARAERLQTTMVNMVDGKARVLDARDLMARYTTDFIGAVGFGLDADSLSDENSAFRQLGIKIFKIDITVFIISVLKELFPKIFQKARVMYRVDKELTDIVKEILKQRNYQPSTRNDFIDLLLECRQKGTIVSESIEKMKPDGTPEIATLEMDDELIAAQVFVFFAAGFETSSSATSYTLHQLAHHPEVQRKVQEEIDRVLNKYEGKICYDAIKEMTYLEWAFKEGMRMFPSLGFLIRETAHKYTIPELNLTMDPGVKVIISLQAMHNDPQYFENPEEFRPERFHPDEIESRNKFVYLPFGEGPRACIGELFPEIFSQLFLKLIDGKSCLFTQTCSILSLFTSPAYTTLLDFMKYKRFYLFI